MRVLVLHTAPWEERVIARAIGRATGMTPVLECDARDASVVLISENALRTNEHASLEHIQHTYPTARILILGDGESPPADIADLVSRGADGYFSMSQGNAKLVSAINIVARGSFWLPDNAMKLVLKKLHEVPADPAALQPSEQLLLPMLHEGLTNGEIAVRLNIAEITVRTRLSRLYRRFHVRTRRQLIDELRIRGFIPPQ